VLYSIRVVYIYCPVCECDLEPVNQPEVDNGEHDGLIYIHKDKPHYDSDIEALEHGIN